LDAAKRFDVLFDTEQALREGRLSGAQAEAVSAAAFTDPGAQQSLLASATVNGLRGLKQDCARVSAAACVDEMAVYERVRRARSIRHWQDPDGTGRIEVRGPIDQTARVMAALEPYERAIFEENRRTGNHARPEQTAFDALVRRCVIAGCHVTRQLEIDHNPPLCDGGTTGYENIHRVCGFHPREKHPTSARLVGEPGQMRLRPNERPPP